ASPLDHLCSASRVPESPQPSLTLIPSLTPSTAPRFRHCWYVLFSSTSNCSRGYRITDIVFPSLGELIDFTSFLLKEAMAGSRVAHATLKGPSVVKEICIGIVLGLAAGGLWKMHHWNEQRKVRQFYDLLEKGEISVIAQEE
ncbi:hypothetical protein F2P56_024965, partial [Juglans regia]